MAEYEKNDKSKAVIAVLGVMALIVAALFFGTKLWRSDLAQESIQSARNKEMAAPVAEKMAIKGQAPIDYEKNGDLMARRKAALGFDKGVDMIVRPGETMKIGKTIVSMDEILDKIRLKTGGIAEQDLSAPAAPAVPRKIDLPTAISRFEALEKEYDRLKAKVEAASEPVDDATRRRVEKIAGPVRLYRQYKEVLQKLAQTGKRLAGADQDQAAVINRDIEALNQEKAGLEKHILAAMQADQDLNAYGVYVVKPGDNIWNIHFQFLRDYFTHKGVNLSPASDEPDAGGKSSGVGRLLKFSETMVHIYNLREKKIDTDLNLIQPLSKIVVFNLARVFAMLDSINLNEVGRIRFDGEMLWLPAKK